MCFIIEHFKIQFGRWKMFVPCICAIIPMDDIEINKSGCNLMSVQWQKPNAKLLYCKFIYRQNVCVMSIAGYCIFVFLYGGRDFLICISFPVMCCKQEK